MSSLHQSDLAGLAMLARAGDRELRPVLLTLHTREFVSSPTRDRRAVQTYEALALGLIPLVPDDVVADVAAMLKQVPEAPPRVLQLLAERRQARSADATAEDEPPAAVAPPTVPSAEADEPLDAHQRHALVGQALQDRELAQALLARPDLSAADRGALFRFAADPAERDRIREELVSATAVDAPNLPPLTEKRRERLLAAAADGDVAGLCGELGAALGLASPPGSGLDDLVEAELFALALVAVGLRLEECVRILLTVDPRIAGSVPRVFRLRQICRTTSRAAAMRILGAEPKPRRTRSTKSPKREAAADGARAASATEPARRSPARPASGPADHRSKSTRGLDRT